MAINYTVAVRALCAFTAKRGDLDLRFTPTPTAQEGIEGHAIVTSRRVSGYRTEVSLSGDYQTLHVRGRADGYDPAQGLLEEIKTFRGDLSAQPENHRHLHWAQARVYGHLMCEKENLTQIDLALVYFDIARQTETVFRETRSADDLKAFFEQQCERFIAWSEQEALHRDSRNAALMDMPFPFPDFRPGQRDLAQGVYQANTSGRCLLAQAPTGIGKTTGVLFPALKAMPRQQIDKVIFLAAKTPGRQLALDSASHLKQPIRILELTARDKACEHPDKACHGESCPLAQGFYDRLPGARQDAVEAMTLDRATLRSIALQHQVCPYFLASEMARWSDLIVGDYNYYFDMGGMLYILSLSEQWRTAVLVDEAHNMVSRARKMYSVDLDRSLLKAARSVAPAHLRKHLDRVSRAWPKAKDEYEVLPALPEKLGSELQGAASAITDHLSEQPGPLEPALQDFYFNALHFGRLAEQFGDHSMCDTDGHVLGIRNIVPAPFLRARFAMAHSVTLFSATLSPWHYFSESLGMPESTAWIDVASPFSAQQLEVRVIRDISTRYQHRSRSVQPIADLIAHQYSKAAGNYLAFFSSFDYLEQVAQTLEDSHPDIPMWRQARRMDEAERAAFLGKFAVDGRGVGFAVLGGAFGEGIDLPGSRLIGAFIATLGLPQVNPVNEQMRARIGYDSTYLYPGLQKVVQAAGRVIRTTDDRGIVYLIDDRFDQRQVQELLPRWWSSTDRRPRAERGDPGAFSGVAAAHGSPT
jgi:Rad3-related DNA helicase